MGMGTYMGYITATSCSESFLRVVMGNEGIVGWSQIKLCKCILQLLCLHISFEVSECYE